MHDPQTLNPAGYTTKQTQQKVKKEKAEALTGWTVGFFLATITERLVNNFYFCVLHFFANPHFH